jgi:hypothetical protein
MTTLTIDLPDNIAKQAQDAGLLTPEALAQLLKDAVRRQAGRRLLDAAQRIQAAGIPPMSDEEIVAEVKAIRAERRARQSRAGNAGRS